MLSHLAMFLFRYMLHPVKDVFIFISCECFATCMPGAYGGEKKTSDPLDLELEKVISCHVDAGNGT